MPPFQRERRTAERPPRWLCHWRIRQRYATDFAGDVFISSRRRRCISDRYWRYIAAAIFRYEAAPAYAAIDTPAVFTVFSSTLERATYSHGLRQLRGPCQDIFRRIDFVFCRFHFRRAFSPPRRYADFIS